MKAIKCEMCDSTDVLKDGDYYICQSCGTKYTVEAARKLMVEGTVTVKIDNSESYDKIVALAVDSMENMDHEAVYKYCSQALEIKPDEAEFITAQGVAILGMNEEEKGLTDSCVKIIEKGTKLFSKMQVGEEKNKTIQRTVSYFFNTLKSIIFRRYAKYHGMDANLDNTQWVGGYVADIKNAEIKSHNNAVENQKTVFSKQTSQIVTFARDSIINLINLTDNNTKLILLCEMLGETKNEHVQLKFWRLYDGYLSRIYKAYKENTLSKDIKKQLITKHPILFYDSLISRSPEYVKMCIDMGADVNARYYNDSTGMFDNSATPLYYIAASKIFNERDIEPTVKITKMLLDAGARVDPNESHGNGTTTLNTDTPEQVLDEILKVQPEAENYITKKKSRGCYVATCVYGSYDCPQVWTLRRFRDDTLGATWYGRAFIRTYYAISPTLVKWFGETSWFKKLWRGKLDRVVKRLNNKGVEDTPYKDKQW